MTDRYTVQTMLRLMAPLLLCNILQQFYNTVDAIVLGRFADENAFAAVGIAGSVMNLFLFLLVGACSGLCVLFSQYHGAGDDAAFRREHFLTLVFGILLSTALAVMGILFLPLLFDAVQVPKALASLVRTYLCIVLPALPAAYLYNLYSAMLRAIQKTGILLAILALCTVLNLFLDLLLVPPLGIAGAALATSIAEGLSALLGFLRVAVGNPELLFHRADCRILPNEVQRTLALSVVTAFHQAGLYIGKLCIQGIINGTDTAIIAAFTASTRIEGFANSFGDSGAAVTQAMTGEAVGRGDAGQVRRCFASSLLLLAILGVLMSVILYVSAGAASFVLLGAREGEAFDACVQYLRLISVFYTFCFVGNTFAGWFDGIGKVRIPFAGAASHITLRILLSLVLIRRMGLAGLALATGIGWIFVCCFWQAWKKHLAENPRSQSLHPFAGEDTMP